MSSESPNCSTCRAACALLGSAEFQQSLQQLRATGEVDYRRLMARKRQVLELLAADFNSRPSPRRDECAQFIRQHPYLKDYAAFRAVCEQRRQPWPEWPAQLRDRQLLATDYDPRVAEYHCFVQWIASHQLQQLADQAAKTGDGLYLDLPLGVRLDSYDVWRNRQAFVVGASAGAPPIASTPKARTGVFRPCIPRACGATVINTCAPTCGTIWNGPARCASTM